MATNPLVSQGFLNRVKASMTVTDTPALNVSASYLAKEMISMRTTGPAADIIQTATGTVISGNVYQPIEIVCHVLRTQALGESWRQRFLSDVSLGEVVVTPDSTVMGDFTILNTALTNWQEMTINGTQASFILLLSGYWVINNDMWA